MNFLMQVSPRDGDKRALRRSTVLKSIFLVVEKEFQVVRDLREFRALNFQIQHNNRQIATGELGLHDQRNDDRSPQTLHFLGSMICEQQHTFLRSGVGQPPNPELMSVP